MMNESRFMSSPQEESALAQRSFQQPVKKPWGPLRWWYSISAPDEGSEAFQEAIISRSRLGSILILITLIVSIAFIPAALTSDGLHVLPPVIGIFIVGCIALPLNRRGHVTIVGVLIVCGVDFALAYSLIFYPNFTLTQNAVPIYDMFVLSDIIAISLLPINSIFYFSAFHSIFMLADIILQPKAADLQLLVNQTTYSFMVRPLAIQIVVALVTFLWVRNTMRALERANKAEVIARLEHTIAMERKDLDEGIQQILYTLVQAANGNLNARAPLAQQNVLWQVGVGLNTLLARLQRSIQNERELQQVKMEIRRLISGVHEAKGRQMLLWLPPGGTELDLLVSELMGCIVYQPSPGPERR